MSSSQKYSVSPPLDSSMEKGLSAAGSGKPAASEKREKKRRCCNADAKWTVLRFVGLCFIAIVILMIVYGIKKSDKGKGARR